MNDIHEIFKKKTLGEEYVLINYLFMNTRIPILYIKRRFSIKTCVLNIVYIL